MKKSKIIAILVFGVCLMHSTISSCIEAVMQKFIKPLTPPIRSTLIDEAGRPES